MTTPLPGDVVLWKSAPYRWSEIRVDGYDKEYRARPVAADDAVLAAVDALRAIVSATVRFGKAPAPLIQRARKALEVVDGH